MIGIPAVIKPSSWTVLSSSHTCLRPDLSTTTEHVQRGGEARDSVRAARREAMAVLAQARAEEIQRGLQAVVEPIDCVDLRAVETGLVMLRGRIGGEGAPFNLGEATVTRAAVQIPSGEVGFSYVLGRDQKKARLSAVCDALWQNRGHRDAVERCVLAPIRSRVEAERAQQRARTAATKVDFFTLVRGED
jgi:alpha-D-ribose 1-methylphosphonate 5-triphosphate synthase subunit PhnG